MIRRIFSNFIPNSIMGRFLLIILVPAIVVQMVAIYIFYERHWSNVSERMLRAVAEEMVMMVQMTAQMPSSYHASMRTTIAETTSLTMTILPSIAEACPLSKDADIIRLYDLIKERITYPTCIASLPKQNQLKVSIYHPQYNFTFHFSRKRFTTHTTYIFILWMTGTATLLILVALLFMRNQLRAITRLAVAAERFGKGQNILMFKPEGAEEVKQAGRAFLEMHERIVRQLHQRTLMLAGVSHDLRTPLTRIKLHLALLSDKDASKELAEDVKQMEKTIQEYLNFARGDTTEQPEFTDMAEFISSIVASFRNHRIRIITAPTRKIKIRPHALQRAIMNILENALRYASGVEVRLFFENNYIKINIQDNGPGIPENEWENIFKPFYRLDPSRNLHTGGVGLGLAIARDIVTSHGGDITIIPTCGPGTTVQIILPA